MARDNSDPIVTAYALFGLSEAAKEGVKVDDTTLNLAISFIQHHSKTTIAACGLSQPTLGRIFVLF